jgi:hypothetical protein
VRVLLRVVEGGLRGGCFGFERVTVHDRLAKLGTQIVWFVFDECEGRLWGGRAWGSFQLLSFPSRAICARSNSAETPLVSPIAPVGSTMVVSSALNVCGAWPCPRSKSS